MEVKYALDEAELRQELDGIYADINGYAGDDRWTRFFALFYTATPVAAPERMLEEFKLSRVDVSWTPIIVHGAGDRATRIKGSSPSGKARETRGKAPVPKRATVRTHAAHSKVAVSTTLRRPKS